MSNVYKLIALLAMVTFAVAGSQTLVGAADSANADRCAASCGCDSCTGEGDSCTKCDCESCDCKCACCCKADCECTDCGCDDGTCGSDA